MKNNLYTEEYVKAEVGCQSLIGTVNKRPTEWGNYFSLTNGISIVNMWAENLEDACEKFLKDGLVKIRNYGTVAIITDERIPENYYYNKCCFTGAGPVSIEVARDIYEKLGDPHNQLLQFTDKKEHHRLRGETVKECRDENGKLTMYIISSPVNNNPNARKLKGKWTSELSAGVVYCPYIPLMVKELVFNSKETLKNDIL